MLFIFNIKFIRKVTKQVNVKNVHVLIIYDYHRKSQLRTVHCKASLYN